MINDYGWQVTNELERLYIGASNLGDVERLLAIFRIQEDLKNGWDRHYDIVVY
jgi:hypothetical protein